MPSFVIHQDLLFRDDRPQAHEPVPPHYPPPPTGRARCLPGLLFGDDQLWHGDTDHSLHGFLHDENRSENDDHHQDECHHQYFVCIVTVFQKCIHCCSC